MENVKNSSKSSAKKLPPQQLSAIFMELGLIAQAGITIANGLSMLAEDELDKDLKHILNSLYEDTDVGMPLSEAMANVKDFPNIFPQYAVDMISTGERTGRMEQVLFSLSDYYYRRDQLAKTIKSAVVYPALLLVMILVIVIILITQVLPIFNTVYNQLGAQMSSVATAMMNFGDFIKNNLVVVIIALAVLLAAGFFLGRFIYKRSGLVRKIAISRFASSLAMSFSSGLDVEESFEVAGKMVGDSILDDQVQDCKKYIENGDTFSNALAKAKIFPVLYSSMLTSGFKTGSADTIMNEIVRRIDENVNDEIDEIVSSIEPALVIIMSILIGFILLSVMLPLMNMMTFIGG